MVPFWPTLYMQRKHEEWTDEYRNRRHSLLEWLLYVDVSYRWAIPKHTWAARDTAFIAVTCIKRRHLTHAFEAIRAKIVTLRYTCSWLPF